MPRYQRLYLPGATYFFTLVTFERRRFLTSELARRCLRAAWVEVRRKHPFEVDAVCLLPDHLHCLWTLPADDADYSTRWMLVKSHFTRRCAVAQKLPPSRSLRNKRQQTIWQGRFWEHQIRGDKDFERHCDYIHYNPVKHGYVNRVVDWPHSSFHRFVHRETYPPDWGEMTDIMFEDGFGE